MTTRARWPSHRWLLLTGPGVVLGCLLENNPSFAGTSESSTTGADSTSSSADSSTSTSGSSNPDSTGDASTGSSEGGPGPACSPGPSTRISGLLQGLMPWQDSILLAYEQEDRGMIQRLDAEGEPVGVPFAVGATPAFEFTLAGPSSCGLPLVITDPTTGWRQLLAGCVAPDGGLSAAPQVLTNPGMHVDHPVAAERAGTILMAVNAEIPETSTYLTRLMLFERSERQGFSLIGEASLDPVDALGQAVATSTGYLLMTRGGLVVPVTDDAMALPTVSNEAYEHPSLVLGCELETPLLLRAGGGGAELLTLDAEGAVLSATVVLTELDELRRLLGWCTEDAVVLAWRDADTVGLQRFVDAEPQGPPTMIPASPSSDALAIVPMETGILVAQIEDGPEVVLERHCLDE